ncbi:MAG TPA: DUF4198 domain-containing protein [Desulfobulbaceae bacterium]|nr:DUF4198 domain-containing protein [Desulfobulbaceae bacterium]
MSCSRLLSLLCCGTLAVSFCSNLSEAEAHFGAIIPSKDIIGSEDKGTISLDVEFLHPFEQQFLPMAKPKAFGVLHRGHKSDLLSSLEERRVKGKDQQEAVAAWRTEYKIKQPGDYIFFLEPEPYWEAAEDLYIIHYTKVCVQAFGMEEGWDEPLGLKTEIIPLTRPYGLWSGNVFTGQVLRDGQPLTEAEVEVEYLNNQGKVKAPADAFITQTVKTDSQGIFTYAMPHAGWWGFAALSEDNRKIKRDGVEKAVEIGAVYWVHTTDMR